MAIGKANKTESGATVLLSTLRPYAVSLGYPVTVPALFDSMVHAGACRAELSATSPDDPAFVVASLPEPLRQAVEAAGPQMLAFLRLQIARPRGIERAKRHNAVVSGHPDLLFVTAEAMRMTPEDLMTILLDGDAIPTRLSEEVAVQFGANLDWLLCRDLSTSRSRH